MLTLFRARCSIRPPEKDVLNCAGLIAGLNAFPIFSRSIAQKLFTSI